MMLPCRSGGVTIMTNAERLRFLARKCDQLASSAPNENIRGRHLELAASYRRLAEREDFLEGQARSKAEETV